MASVSILLFHVGFWNEFCFGFQLAFAVFAAVVLIAEAGGHGQGPMQGESRMARSGWGGQQQQGQRQGADQGGNQGWDQQGGQGQGWNQQGRQQGGADARYRANILDDDDVYGYDAKYPNGEVVFVNYRNTDARARRGMIFFFFALLDSKTGE